MSRRQRERLERITQSAVPLRFAAYHGSTLAQARAFTHHVAGGKTAAGREDTTSVAI